MTTSPVREAEAAAPPERVAERRHITAGLRYCLLVFIAFRVGITILEVTGVALLPGLDPVGVPEWPAQPTRQGWHNLVTTSERFDALWFLSIAAEGYRDGDGSAAFFPGYPLLIRTFTPVVGGHPLAAALLVSNLAAFGAMVVLYFLTAAELGEPVARRAVLYLAVFPTSFFLVAPYSEAPFLLFVLLALWAARRGRWEIAGLAGAAAALTRNLGIVLIASLVVEAIRQARSRSVNPARAAAWSVVPALGTAAYIFFWWRFSGDPLAPLQQQATWQREFLFPLGTLVAGTREAFRFPGVYPGGYHLLDWLIVVPALAAAVWVAVRAALPYSLYTGLSILVPLSLVFLPRPFMSLPRFLLVVFPILWAPAALAERRPWIHGATVATSAALLGIMTVLFAAWYYVF